MDQWQQVEDLFHATLGKDAADRTAFLAAACGGDESLRREVENLIAAHHSDLHFIDQPAFEAASRVLTVTPLEPGQTVGHYEIRSLIGEGGMGVVYLAEDTRLRRRIALKLLPPQYTIDPERVRRFEQEARAASALNHPYIVTIHEIGSFDGTQFIVTEFVEGHTLRHLMNEKPFTIKEALNVVIQIAEALQAAHAAGIVHRDIKPENIMLRSDGYVKVLDFGLAKLTEPVSGKQQLERSTFLRSNPRMVMGTAQYMSPEQARGTVVDARTDIWSLGVLLYELLAGHVPFNGETPSHVMVSLMEDELPPLIECVSLPAELDRIVTKALRKNKNERYQSAKELARDLRNVKQQLQLQKLLKDSPAATVAREQSAIGPPMLAQIDRAENAPSAAVDVTRPTSSAEYLVSQITQHRRGAMLAATAVLVLTAVIFSFAVIKSSYFDAAAESIDSIAVLPFVNVGNDPNVEYLSDGISDSIVVGLSKLPNIKKIIPFSSVLRYKGQTIDPHAVGRELNVGAVLTGRLTLRGDEVLVSTELVDVKNNKRLWGGQYSHKLADVFKLQGEIAQDTSEKLRLKLTGEQKERLAKPTTENAEALQLYLQGRYYLGKNTDEATLKSGEYFERAIEKDPNFALAYVESAFYYNIMANFGNMRPNEARLKAEEAAVRALAIDDSLARGHSALAGVKMWYDWDWAGAEREFKRAIELEPEPDRRDTLYPRLLQALGRFDEAIAEINKAGGKPGGVGERGPRLADILHSARRYDQAIEEYRKQLEREPNLGGFLHLQIGMVYVQQGKYQEALAEVRQARPAVTQPRQLARIGYVYAAAGKRDEAVRILEEVKALAGERYNLGTHIAAIYAALGNKDEALAWLKKACDEHEQGVVDLKIDQRFDTLRSDPRFMDLLRRVKLAP